MSVLHSLLAGGFAGWNQAADTRQTWSPDGEWIAYAANKSADWDVYIMNTDGFSTRVERPVIRLMMDSPIGRQMEQGFILRTAGKEMSKSMY